MKIHSFVFSPIEVNTYILADNNGRCIIIDCGCYDEGEFKQLKSFISLNHMEPVALLNTHLHLDHIFGNHFVLDYYGLKTHACREDEMNLLSSPTIAEMFGLSMPQPPGIGHYVEDGQEIHAGDISLRCLFVPGHTAGSIAYHNEKEGVVFTGDTLFAGGIGRTDLPGGDQQTLMQSIRDSLLTLPDDTIVYPGHGPRTTIGNERKHNPFLS